MISGTRCVDWNSREPLGRLLTLRQQSALNLLDTRRRGTPLSGVLTAGYSDGSRQAPDRLPTRTDRQPDSAARLRVKQPLESTCPGPTSMERNGSLRALSRSNRGFHKPATSGTIFVLRKARGSPPEGHGVLPSTRRSFPSLAAFRHPCSVPNTRFVSARDSCSDPRGACRPGKSPGSTCIRSACSSREPAEPPSSKARCRP